MVAGHLQEKKGYYYAVLSYLNKRKQNDTFQRIHCLTYRPAFFYYPTVSSVTAQ